MTTISLITPKRLLLLAATTMLALAIAAAAPALSRAAAQTYCVHQAGFTCPAGASDEGSDLQAALNNAAGNPSTASSPNVITIGPGTYRPNSVGQGFIAQTPSPLQVRGAGVGQTTLTDSGAQGIITLAGMSGGSVVSLSGVTVGGSAADGVLIANGSVDHVAVDPSGPDSSDENAIVLSASTVKDSTVTLPAGSDDSGLVIGGGGFSSNEIDDVTVDGGRAGVRGRFGAVIHRARLIGNATSVLTESAPIYIDDSLLVGGGLQAMDGNSGEGSIQAVNDTIVASGRAGVAAVSVSDLSSGSDIAIYNSVVHGFPTSFETIASPSGAPTLEAFNDSFDGTTHGTSITVAGQIPGVPDFVNPGAGDYRLAWNSPLIDAGNTGLVSAASSATDLDGNPREVPSSTAPSSPLDVGAYEYQHRTPSAVASAAPASAPPGSAFTFDGSRSSDPDQGDTLTYAWSFDDGATGIGATVTHVFNTPGTHTGTLTVTDPTGLASKQQATVTVTSPPAPPTTTPPTTTPPTTTPSTTKSTGTNTNPATPHLTVLGKPSVRGNKVTLQLSCIGSTACTGTRVTETTNKTSHVASVRLSLKPGQTKTITLTVNGKGKGLLAHLGKLPVVITVTLNTATVKTAHATLHAPKKPRHRHP